MQHVYMMYCCRKEQSEKYSTDGSELECTAAEKDLGTIVDLDLEPEQHNES